MLLQKNTQSVQPAPKPAEPKNVASMAPDLSALLEEAEQAVIEPVKPAPAPKPAEPKNIASMAPDLSALLAEAEQAVIEKETPAPAPKPAEPDIDIFNLQEAPAKEADKFQPEEEKILDIDSFSQSGGMMNFSTGIRARAAGGPPPQQKKKKGGDGFDWDELVAENNAATKKKKRRPN